MEDICKIHNIRNKFFCLKKDCEINNRYMCSECVADGPHYLH